MKTTESPAGKLIADIAGDTAFARVIDAMGVFAHAYLDFMKLVVETMEKEAAERGISAEALVKLLKSDGPECEGDEPSN